MQFGSLPCGKKEKVQLVLSNQVDRGKWHGSLENWIIAG